MLLALLLIGQFLIRAHNPTEQALFIDEYRHIDRAHDITDGVHPAQESRGKMLLYVWLAPFRTDWDAALHVNRTAVALFSLLTSAGLFLLVRHWLNRAMGVLAVAVYTVFPLALFYERMVLVDGIATGLMVFAVWFAWRLARKPTFTRAYHFGAMAALATMAKLTTAFSIAVMPVTAALLIGPVALQRLNRENIMHIVNYWWPYALRVIGMFAFLWSFTLLPALYAHFFGDTFYLVVISLLGGTYAPAEGFPPQIFATVHPAMLLFIGVTAALGYRVLPRRYVYALVWLVATLLPPVVFLRRVHTRYIMLAAAPLTLLIVMGVWSLWQLRSPVPRAVRGVLAAAAVGAWVLFFAGPFAYNAAVQPAETPLPENDSWHYFQSPYNSFGYLMAFDWLRDNADPRADGQYDVMSFGWMCERTLIPYGITDMDLYCVYDYHHPGWSLHGYHHTHLDAIDVALREPTPQFLIIDHEYEMTSNPFPNCAVHWEHLVTLERPKDGQPVSIWRPIPNGDGHCSRSLLGG